MPSYGAVHDQTPVATALVRKPWPYTEPNRSTPIFFAVRCRLYPFVLLIGISAGAAAQGPAAPELKPLERYLGSWTYNGEDKTPGTGGSVTCTTTRRWISAGYFVESHRICDTPRGTFEQVEVFGFDFTTREYTYLGFSGRVVSNYRASSIAGDSVTWVGQGASSGNRCTEVFATDHRSASAKCETAAGGDFILRSEGRYDKVVE